MANPPSQVATRPQSAAATAKKDIRGVIESMREQIRRALPKHMDPDRMIRVMLTTVNGNQKLLDCTQESLLAALMKCSQYGLEPDGRHAHLIPYKDQCQLIFDYKGLVALTRRTGEIADIHCDVVYTGDEFEASFGNEGKLLHRPNIRADKEARGEIYCAYSYVKLKDGSVSYEVMPSWEIDAIKENSQGFKAFKNGYTKSNPWDTNWAEMAKKTAFRRHSKWLPLSFELQEALNADDDKIDEEKRFQAAKPAIVTEHNFLPEPRRDETLEQINTQAAQPEGEKVPAGQDEAETTQAAQASTASGPHAELRKVLTEAGIQPDKFFTWAEQGGHIPEGTASIDSISAARVNVLLKGKAAMLKELGGSK